MPTLGSPFRNNSLQAGGDGFTGLPHAVAGTKVAELIHRRFAVDDTYASAMMFEGLCDIPEPPLSLSLLSEFFFQSSISRAGYSPYECQDLVEHPFDNLPSSTFWRYILHNVFTSNTNTTPSIRDYSLIPMDFFIVFDVGSISYQVISVSAGRLPMTSSSEPVGKAGPILRGGTSKHIQIFRGPYL
jgi:hypothetical protein